MIKIYFHLHDAESRQQMNNLDLLNGGDGDSDGKNDRGSSTGETAEPNNPEP